MDPSRWQACEDLVKDLAAGEKALALPQPTQLQRTLKTPSYVLYLCGLVAGSQEHFVKFQKLYHQSSHHNDEPRIYHWSPSMMPSEADQLRIDQDIIRKLQELQTASENIQEELLASLADETEHQIYNCNNIKNGKKGKHHNNNNKKKKTKQDRESKNPIDYQDDADTSTTHKKYETLEQVLAQFQVPQYESETEQDDSWVQVGKKSKLPAKTKTAISKHNAAYNSDLNSKENDTTTTKETIQLAREGTESAKSEFTAPTPNNSQSKDDEIAKTKKLPHPSDDREAISVSDAASSHESDDIKTNSNEEKEPLQQQPTETGTLCVNTVLTDEPTTTDAATRILIPPIVVAPLTNPSQKGPKMKSIPALLEVPAMKQNKGTSDNANASNKYTPPLAGPDTDHATLAALETRIQQLELTVQEKDGELQKQQELHHAELRKQCEQFEERIQALQLRLYISENRLRTYEEALVDHVNAVATNVAEGTAVVTTTANASVTTPKGSTQAADHNSDDDTPLEHSPGKRPWMSTNSTAKTSLSKVATN